MSEPSALRDPDGSVDAAEHLDMIIVGAGLSGVDAAYRLQSAFPARRYAILEARAAIGGTWDLFRYPGIRSDSDMHTLGFPFRPWRGEKSIADGDAIRDYIRDTAAEFGIDRHIRFGHRVTRASWSSADARWTVEGQDADGRPFRLTAGFLFMCSGYYDYAAGYMPDFPDLERFAGRVVHPQQWPEDLAVEGRRVVVIGSGATAMTLVPALVRQGAHVTMLQRSPTYVVSRAARDPIALWLHRRLPGGLADRLVRWKNILLGITTYRLARRSPDRVRRMILDGVRRQLGAAVDIDRHFSPSYNPWDQRVCLVPDGDLFTALREGKAEIVTDGIAGFAEDGIRLASGERLPADIVVSATGLVIQLMGGAEILVDGVRVQPSDRMLYKGMMFDDIPNFAFAFGYTNASWTLKCDLTARYVCRLLKHMDRRGYAVCVPRLDARAGARQPMLDFSSGYVRRANALLPGQGRRAPWRVHQNYILDFMALGIGSVDDGAMEFGGAKPAGGAA